MIPQRKSDKTDYLGGRVEKLNPIWAVLGIFSLGLSLAGCRKMLKTELNKMSIVLCLSGQFLGAIVLFAVIIHLTSS